MWCRKGTRNSKRTKAHQRAGTWDTSSVPKEKNKRLKENKNGGKIKIRNETMFGVNKKKFMEMEQSIEKHIKKEK